LCTPKAVAIVFFVATDLSLNIRASRISRGESGVKNLEQKIKLPSGALFIDNFSIPSALLNYLFKLLILNPINTHPMPTRFEPADRILKLPGTARQADWQQKMFF
jgi:hypothetical protein